MAFYRTQLAGSQADANVGEPRLHSPHRGSARKYSLHSAVRPFVGLLVLAALCQRSALAQDVRSPIPPQGDTSVIAGNGSAHITRIIPIPDTVSLQARRKLASPVGEPHGRRTLAQIRADADATQATAGEAYRARHSGELQATAIAGVPVKIITPAAIPPENQALVLINLHGGGGTQDTGSLTESLPLANRAKIRVIAVLYRLAPEHPFPAAVDDAVAVYRELLRTHGPRDIGVFGTSSGAILTAEFAVRLRRLGLTMPGALGIFSGMGDFSRNGDSQALFSQDGLSGPLSVPAPPETGGDYAGTTNLQDPALSPVYADLQGLPPTLFITSTRDMLLSGTTILHRAFLRAGVDARLVVFEALPHAFWDDPALPETAEAIGLMAQFFASRLGHQPP